MKNKTLPFFVFLFRKAISWNYQRLQKAFTRQEEGTQACNVVKDCFPLWEKCLLLGTKKKIKNTIVLLWRKHSNIISKQLT